MLITDAAMTTDGDALSDVVVDDLVSWEQTKAPEGVHARAGLLSIEPGRLSNWRVMLYSKKGKERAAEAFGAQAGARGPDHCQASRDLGAWPASCGAAADRASSTLDASPS